VEIEQIVIRVQNDFLTDKLPIVSSFVQVRGSIPFFWSQQPNLAKPKPDIVFEKHKDKHLVATRKHIGRLFQKYSFPLHFLNLTKANNNREETVAA
jgi:hypothetical protein